MHGLPLTWASEDFVIVPERALYWERERALIVADLHIGKPAAYRAWGVPVPEGTTAATVETLDLLIAESGAARLIVLGDLLHARAGRQRGTLAAVAAWRSRHPNVELTLVRGNHDRAAGDPPSSWEIDCHDGPLIIRDIALVHDPECAPKRCTHFLAGHIHPVFALSDEDGSSLRLPCFCFGKRRGLLPAFGAFTGGGRFELEPDDRIFFASEGHVVEVPSQLLRAE